MANKMTPYVERLTTASGHDAREIMIEALTAINDGDINASTLNGKEEAEYLKTDDMNTRIQGLSIKMNKDEKPSTTSENLIMTKGIRSVIGPIPYLR